MYKPSLGFEQPKNQAVKVWRYMDFTKFVSMIESGCLFFSRADRAGDAFEGSWPQINIRLREQMWQNIMDKMDRRLSDGPDPSEFGLASRAQLKERFPRLFREIFSLRLLEIKMHLKQVFINCWHMNNHESAAMWKLYVRSNEGIAVQSSYKHLRDSIIDDQKVHLGVVQYIDYEKERVPAGANFFVYKRKSFEHEREVRAVVFKRPYLKIRSLSEKELEYWIEKAESGQLLESDKQFLGMELGYGLKIRVDMNKLVERIYVAPTAPEWFADLVRALVRKYGFEFEVVQSKLDEQPVY
jgi:hypothetical protein